MVAGLVSYLRQHHIGLLALCIALSGTAYAATLPRNSVGAGQLKKNAVTSPKVKGGSLLLSDFKASQRANLTGAQGARGPQGERGVQGVPGAAGATNVTVRLGASALRDSTAFCNPGERAVGGGGLTNQASSFLYDSSPSQTSGTPTSWDASAEDTSGADATVQATSSALRHSRRLKRSSRSRRAPPGPGVPSRGTSATLTFLRSLTRPQGRV